MESTLPTEARATHACEDITLVVADGQRLLLDGIASYLRAEKDFELLETCVNAEEALATVERCSPEILVVDLDLPGGGGLEVQRRLRERGGSRPKTVLLAEEVDEQHVMNAMRLGIRGVLLKQMAAQQLSLCIRKVSAGGQWLEKEAAGRALERLLIQEAAAQRLANTLTARELEMVSVISRGLSNKEAARQLSITEGTVKIHLHNIYQKLEIRGRMELMLYAQEKGLINPGRIS